MFLIAFYFGSISAKYSSCCPAFFMKESGYFLRNSQRILFDGSSKNKTDFEDAFLEWHFRKVI